MSSDSPRHGRLTPAAAEYRKPGPARGSQGKELTPLPTTFNKAKGRTLSTYLIYALCAGQLPASKAGYARLPRNLVKGGLLQVANIPGHVHVPAECPRPSGAGGPPAAGADPDGS